MKYPCPDLAALDEHMSALSGRIGHAERNLPYLVAVFRADMDLLLDRRLWLALTTEPA